MCPLATQEEIIQLVQGCKFIMVIDAASSFYQWAVWTPHWNRQALVSRRGQEFSKVALMGYCNSVKHVQRQMDNNLRKFRAFCRGYIDDAVTTSPTLEEHREHLHLVFRRLQDLNVALEPKKTFIGLPSIRLLGQRVDGLGMAAAEDKLEALRNLAFPETLKQLEKCLGATGHLRHYIKGFDVVLNYRKDTRPSNKGPSHPPTLTAAENAAGRAAIAIEKMAIIAERTGATAEEARTAANAALVAVTGFEEAMNPYEAYLCEQRRREWVQRQWETYGVNPLRL